LYVEKYLFFFFDMDYSESPQGNTQRAQKEDSKKERRARERQKKGWTISWPACQGRWFQQLVENVQPEHAQG